MNHYTIAVKKYFFEVCTQSLVYVKYSLLQNRYLNKALNFIRLKSLYLCEVLVLLYNKFEPIFC